MAIYPSNEEPISAASPVTASQVPALPVPTHGGGKFSILAKTRIAAPPAEVLSVIRNTNEWERWNTFCPQCIISPKSPPAPEQTHPSIPTGKEGWLELGTIATIDVFMNGDGLVGGGGRKKSRDQGIVVTYLEELKEEGKNGYRIAWKSTGWAHWQLHSERVMEFVETEDGGTEYTCWETFGGVLAVTVKMGFGHTLADRFGDYARDVKGFLEGSKGREGGKGGG
jgi:hypothetical protein